MVTVRLDRNSVAGGDDSPRVEWEFPDGATIRDLVVRSVEEYLAKVGGDVTWRLSTVGGPDLLVFDVGGYPVEERGVSMLARIGSQTLIVDIASPSADGAYEFFWHYGGGRATWEWFTMSDEDMAALVRADIERGEAIREGNRLGREREKRTELSAEPPVG
jgi:hypothetical protein